MCEFHDANCNGLGDIWWTDKCMYFSSIGVFSNVINLCPHPEFTLFNVHDISKHMTAMRSNWIGPQCVQRVMSTTLQHIQ